ncbi:hypothetical protein GOBAR_DD18895 [Gossypium barbadense]|nr:hypothetical protein GOBAR_DD18895 [Gossypium barbadense]
MWVWFRLNVKVIRVGCCFNSKAASATIMIHQESWLVTLDLSTFTFPGLKLEEPNLGTLVRNVTRLKFLYLDGVNLSATGNEWCQALSPLTELQVLNMSGCYLSGPIHSSLSMLRSLSVIHLDFNNLSASVPKFFAGFPNLTSLSLTYTNLSGRLPDEIFQIPTLQTLDLSDNDLLRGSFQKFSPNLSLQTLSLSRTNFEGQVPESLGNLGKLTRIELAECNFSGAIPKTMKKLTQLVYLDFSFNRFSGPIPSFSSSRNLTYLSLGYNQLNGGIHSTDWSSLSKLEIVDLQKNKFSGTIPPALFCIPSLQRLFLSQNQFKGNLSDLHGKASLLLEGLDLSSNKLQGQFPMSVFELRGLKFLSLSSNNFSGLIPMRALQNLKNLSSLDLSYNSLSIDATDTNVSSLSFPNITTLKLTSCNLTEFPDFLIYQSRLSYLDLSNNQIQGKIPNWIWKVRSLRYLNLSQNFLVKFERSLENIISSLNVLDLHGNRLQGKIEILPSNATYLDYSNNNFNSVLPAQIGDFLQFAYFFSVSGNNFNGSIPKSICCSLYLRVLDMSDNYLSGPIPKCLTQMSASLGVLNLRGNNLSGIISDTFPESCKLQTLDLNQNRLEGKVPQSLGNCKKLEVVDIGNNQISGSFPCHLKNISKLRVLVLRSNKFNGSIHCHKNNTGWPMLQIVDLASNNFSGKLHQKCLATWKGMQVFENEDQSKVKDIQFQFLEFYPNHYQDAITVTIKACHNFSGGGQFWCMERATVLCACTRLLLWKTSTVNGRALTTRDKILPTINPFHKVARPHFLTDPLYSVTCKVRSSMKIPARAQTETDKMMKKPKTMSRSKARKPGIETLRGEDYTVGALTMIHHSIARLPSLIRGSHNGKAGDEKRTGQHFRCSAHLLSKVLEANFRLGDEVDTQVGQIPTGTQLQSFSKASFENNPGLYGPPLTVKCVNASRPKNDSPSDSETGSIIEWNLLSVEIGLIFGLGIIIVPLIYWKRWRIWYFERIHRALSRFFPSLSRETKKHGRRANRNERRRL